LPLYSFIGRDRPGALTQRQAVRPSHLKHLDRLGDKVIFAGPFQDEAGQSTGSLVVVEADDLAAAKAIFARDPYITEGVFGDWEVSRFALTINKSAGH
jgi:uncharacterized protein YciI